MTDLAPKVIEIDYKTRPVWRAQRTKSIGASELGALLGCDPYGRTQMTIWHQKVYPEADEDRPLYRFRRGHHMESLIAEWYAETTGRKVIDPGDYVVAHRSDYPLLTATVDRKIFDPELGEGRAEFKLVDAFQRGKWNEQKDDILVAPKAFRLQLQGQMWIGMVNWGEVVADLNEEEPRRYAYDAVKTFDAIRRVIDRFWKYVETETPPPPTADDSETIKKLLPREIQGKVIELGSDAAQWALRLDSANEQVENAKKLQKEARNNLAVLMGNAEYGVLPDGSRISYKTERRREHYVEASSTRKLSRLK